MPYDPDKVDAAHADIFHHGDSGRGLEDDQWDRQKAEMIANGTYPFPVVSEEENE